MAQNLAEDEKPEASVATDLQDERLRQTSGLRASLSAFVERTKAGDIGVLPVIAGLVLIWTVFQILNPIFLSSANLSNLAIELAPVGVMSLGIVVVLLIGQIDLSVGSVSGLSSAIIAVTFVVHRWPIIWCVLIAIGAGLLIGWFYGQAVNRLGVPSFVVTLAGLLGFLGLQLWVLGDVGTYNIPFDSQLVRFAQLGYLPPTASYVLVALAAAGLFASGFMGARTRRKAGLSSKSLLWLSAQSAILLVIGIYGAWYLNQSRGVGGLFVLFVVLVLMVNYALTRTKWGRSVFAVGGNAEAARRAGINVPFITTSAFMLCSSLAAVGGILAAARLASANQGSGTGDANLNAIAAAVIGGTSLFGGRGSAFSALLGMVVIQSISSGLTLLDLSSAIRFMVTGAVLLIAVALDSVARRSRSAHGRA
jgi:simple sugar transport system permease protein/D-xylose transport system permease protein